MSTDDLAAGLVDVARRAVAERQDAPNSSSQRPVEGLGETPEGDHRGGIGPRPALTITEAAKAAGVDRRTVRRRLDAGELPHAYRQDDGEGPWRIPIDDLLAAGLHLHAPAPPPPDDSAGPARGPAPPPPERAELAEWRRRAEVAEALAAERERTIRALELALRALEPGPGVVVPAPAPVTPGDQPASTPAPPTMGARRRWWHLR